MTIKAYVDGSYSDGKVGYGAVLLENNKLVQEFSGEVKENISTRQVAGELVAVMTVLDYCRDNSIDTLEIYYDYTGIENWATGNWKTNNPLTKRYAQYVKTCPINIIWRKVKSHSGNKWNDKADELAKQGAGFNDKSVTEAQKPNDDTVMLAAVGEAFAHHLSEQDIEAIFDSVKNNQYARLIITIKNKRLGFFDLYNTKNRPLDPYLHGFKNQQLVAQLTQLWVAYKAQL